ncbi:MAG TPA: alcohol dehydrogenase catalytic domain-containing protein [Terriglobales bacterium]|nr:alcohol dehydrogenase catalytic domain-containing protein [Terriglobales bacterium]
MMTVHSAMTAAVLHGKEDLRIERVPVPALQPGEVLVKVGAALTCGTDLKVYRRGYHARMIKPPALFGHEVAGEIVEVGAGVSRFKQGMRVVAANSAPCGVCFYCQRHQENLCDDLLFNNGAYAEYIRIPQRIVQKNLLPIPTHLSFASAAMVEPLACVLLGLHESETRAEDTIAVIGAGPIGLMFIQAAKARACRVISIVKNEPQIATARRFGADEVIQLQPALALADSVRGLTEGRGADVVVEAVGRPEAWQHAIDLVRKGGCINFFGGCASGTKVELDTNRVHYSALRMRATFHHTPASIRDALSLIAENQVRSKDYITGEAPLASLPEVFRMMADRGSAIKTAILPGAK